MFQVVILVFSFPIRVGREKYHLPLIEKIKMEITI